MLYHAPGVCEPLVGCDDLLGASRTGQIELPVYSTLEIMRQRLLTAITYGDGFLLR